MLDREQERELERLFNEALDLPEEQRSAFVDGASKADPALGARLRALLTEDAAGTHSVLQRELPGLAGLKDAPRVGPYRLLHLLGEGGMGTVFLAQQEEPVRRLVALKMIRAGMASDTVVARFEAERETLARMEHSGIARMYFAGRTEDGRPYLAMEYVDGLPLGRHCREARLTIDQRIELFCKVCDAVQYAHQQGIIHRDLKPTNVLVTDEDGVSQPKIIDFGIARATAGSLIATVEETYPGGAPGTRAYMSPEQASSTRPVDTRSDIHALGVMLYELLVGELPYDTKALAERGLDALQRALLEEDPPTPSRRFEALDGATAAAHARERRSTPRGVLEALRGDLDWIIMRAIEKNPAQRYPSASELKADLQRHLRDEPVLAGPPTTAYRVAKFVRRHRLGTTLTTLTVLSVLIALVATLTSLQGARAAAARERGLRERLALKSLRNRAVAELFSYSLPGDVGLDARMTVRQIVDRAAESVRERFAGRPEEEAAARYVLGTTYLRLGDVEAAHAQFQQAYANQMSFEQRDLRGQFKTLARLVHTTHLLEGAEAVVRLEDRCTELGLEILRDQNPQLEKRLRALLAQVKREQLPVGAIEQNLAEVLQLIAEDSDTTLAGVWLVARLIAERPEVAHLPADEGYLAGLWDITEGRTREEEIESLTLRWFVARTHLMPPQRDFISALEESTKLLAAARRFLPPGHWILVDAERLRGEALVGLERFEEAETSLLEAQRTAETRETHPAFPLVKTRAALAHLAGAWQAAGRDWLDGSFARWRAAASGDDRPTDWWVLRCARLPAEVGAEAVRMLASQSPAEVPQLALLRGMALVRAGEYQAALELLADVDDPVAGLFRVIALRGAGQVEAADRALAELQLPETLTPELASYQQEARGVR